MEQANLFCISDEELAAERSALAPADRALVDALPRVPAPKKHDTRRDNYIGPFPRKRHYHRCPECKKHGSGGVNCYKQRCTVPVLMSSPCSWCRPVDR
jgi:hypothetical protein